MRLQPPQVLLRLVQLCVPLGEAVLGGLEALAHCPQLLVGLAGAGACAAQLLTQLQQLQLLALVG